MPASKVTADEATARGGVRSLPRNVWVVTFTSFLTDISSEMVLNLLPLFLSETLGVKTNVIGLIEGIADATASLLKVFSGWLSDRLGSRKWLAVIGYGLSAVAKPFLYFATAWSGVLAVRFADRVVGDSYRPARRAGCLHCGRPAAGYCLRAAPRRRYGGRGAGTDHRPVGRAGCAG